MNIFLRHAAVPTDIATKSDGFDFVPHFVFCIRVGTEAVVVKKNLIETYSFAVEFRFYIFVAQSGMIYYE